jgi:hypothetical protein
MFVAFVTDKFYICNINLNYLQMKINVNFTKVIAVLMLTFFSVQLFASNELPLDLNDQSLWAGVALVVSELASLISKKYTGIIQGLFLVARSIFASKKK